MKLKLTPADILKKNKSVTCRQLDDDFYVIIFLLTEKSQSVVFELNNSSYDIFQLVNGKNTITAIINKLQKKYPDVGVPIAKDTMAILDKMVAKQILVKA